MHWNKVHLLLQFVVPFEKRQTWVVSVLALYEPEVLEKYKN